MDGVIRIPEDKANLPTIPATPMPYGDAVELMKIMKGLIRFDETSHVRLFQNFKKPNDY